MNQYRMQFAPGVWKPSLKPWFVKLIRPLRIRHQHRVQQLMGCKVTGLEQVHTLLDDGCGVMLMPNHPSHADPFSIYMAADELEVPLHVMATWHVFHGKPRLTQWILQSHGCFSVDREANDVGAFRQAVDLLGQCRVPMVIFPEGEIYHCNDRVTPFREGAAAIAVAAARRAKRPVYCVPVALSYRYLEDPTDKLTELMAKLEKAILWRVQSDRSLVDRIYRFAEALLALKEIEYFDIPSSGTLSERIKSFRSRVLESVEKQYELNGSGMSLPERVKAARKRLMDKLHSEEENLSEAERKRCTEAFEDLFIVVQSFSYPGDYIEQKPTIERIAETFDKFEEDVLNLPTATIKAPRTVTIQFGEPVEISKDRKDREQVSRVSKTIEGRVQSMLEEIRGPSTIVL